MSNYNKKKKTLYTSSELCLIGIFVTLMIVCSLISIPTAIPFTLQTFAVCSIGGLLGVKNGLTALLVYFFIGIIGVPVFSNGNGGIGVLLGPTGGYLIGFFFIILFTGLSVKKAEHRPYILISGIILGHILCYIFGTLWYLLIYTDSGTTLSVASITATLSICVLPYLIPDMLKGFLAFIFIKKIKQTNILNISK